ncbi:MAG: sulfite exporter TauE/SafE family protein [Bacillota bacterium]|nr:MAG: hypothetical protein DIU69_02200 [Bacillota bacterium]
MELSLVLGLAVLLGIRHALDPDHLVAVSTLVSEERRLWPAARLGLIWGIGHLIPIALVGLPLVLLRLQLPPRMEELADLGVGVLLVALGAVTLVRVVRERVHFDVHTHDDTVHGHFHRPGHRHPSVELDRRQWVTLGFGFVHGLAGSGSAAVLAMQAAPTFAGAVLWVLVFGLGTILGMFGMTLFIAAPALAVVSRQQLTYAAVRVLAGLCSVAFGGYMIWTILPGVLA